VRLLPLLTFLSLGFDSAVLPYKPIEIYLAACHYKFSRKR